MARQAKDGSFPQYKKNPAIDRLIGRTRSGDVGTFDWGDVDPKLLAGCAGIVTRQGDGFSLSTNSAHTGGAVTILSGGERPRYPVFTAEEADTLLAAIYEAYAGGPEL